MNIFDPLISGSLSVSGSGEISGDLTVLGTLFATISGTSQNAISASHAASYTLTSSFGAFTSSYTTGSFNGTFNGDGSGLYNIPASGVTGLNLTRIADGSATASISSANGLRVNTNTEITGALTISGSITLNGVPVGTGKLDEVVFNAYSSSNNTTNSLQNGRLDALEVSTSSLNTFTSSATSRLNTIESTTGSLNTFTSSANVRLTSLESASSSIRTDFNTYTSSNNTTNTSQNNRLNSIESTTGSLNSYTSSTNTRLGVIETSTGSLNTFTSSASGRLTSLESASGSIRTDFNTYTSSNNTTNTTQNGRLTSLEGVTGSITSLNTYTGSNNTIIGTLQTATSSLNSFTSSTSGRLTSLESASGSIRTDFNTYTSSNNTTNTTQNGRLTSIESTTSSLNLYTSSTNTRLGVIETTTGSLNTFTSSATTRLNSLETASGSIRTDFNTYTSSNNTTNTTQNSRLTSLETATGSIISVNTTQNSRLTSLETTTSSLNSYTGSNNTNIGAIHTATSSLNSYTSSTNTRLSSIETSTSSLNTFTSSANGRLSSLESASGSIRTDFNSYTSSNNATNTTQNGRLTSLENVTGSYATTGSNVFIGNQTITGSLFISQNLIVQGSSSLENITASAVSIGTNTIILNTDTPAFRYAGISVFDSGSTNVTASLFYDSLTNQWKFKHVDTGTNDASIMLFGPLGSDIDNTPLLVSNYLTKVEGTNNHGHHLTTSSIFDNGTKVSINSNSEITGSLTVTGVIRSTTTPLVSGSSQIDHNATTNYVANRHIDHSSVSITTLAGSGLTGGGNITTTRDLSIATGGVTNAMLAGSIENGKLSNSSLTIGTTTISLGGTGTTLSGLTSITSTAITGSLQGSISGNAATVTTNANLTGVVTSTGNVTTIANGNITNAMLANSSFHVGTTSISLGRASASQTLTGVSIDGNAATATEVSRTVGAGSEANLLSATIADNDYFRLRVGGVSNSGFVEIATADDAAEPIHVRQYSGTFATLTRTATLLDGSGNTSFPGTVTAPTFSGALSGNASTVTNGVYTTGDQTIGGSKTFSANITNSSAADWYMYGFGARGASAGQYGIGLTADIANRTLSFHVPNVAAYSNSGNTPKFGWYSNGADELMTLQSATGNLVVKGTIGATNLSGINTGDETTTRINALAITTVGTITSGVWNGTAIANANLANSSFHVGTTSISLGRASATQTLTGVSIDGNSSTVGGLSPIQFFNNMGDNHSARTSFDASTPSYNFGFRFVQGSANSPATGGSQYYSWYIGLGNDYPATGSGSYGAMFAVDRNVTTPYLSVRYNENNGFTSWRRIAAGYADAAGNATTATTLQTARLIGGVSFNGSANIDLPGVNTGGNQNTTGNAATVTNGVYTTGDQTIGGTKTFSATIVGSINGNSATVGGFAAAQTYTSTGNAAGSFLGGHYSSGGTEKPNSGTFGSGKFKIAMLSGGNLGFGGSWNDVMWVSSYNGGDVKSSHALVFDKYSANVWVSDQDFDSGSWGTGHLLLHTGNYTSYAPSLTGANASGTWGINVTGTAASETLATVTGRGASTSTAISINNTLTVTSGRVIARTGGVNTYGIFSGYDNNNHLVSFRANITGPTSSPTITAGHQTNFIEYAEANDTTGWFFKSSSSTNYEDVVRITRIGITPGSNGTQNLGSSSARWNTIFTSDLSMSNGIGDYTIVEGEEDLFIYNNKTNKVFKFLLQEVDPSMAPAKKVH
jgi:hypothetical protein